MNKLVSKILFSLLLYASYTTSLVAMDEFNQKMQKLHTIQIAQNKNELYPIIRHSQPADKKVNSGFFSPYGWLMLVPFAKDDVIIPVHEFFEEVSLGEIKIDEINKLNISDLEPGVNFIKSYEVVEKYFLRKQYNNYSKKNVPFRVPTSKELLEALKYLFAKYAEKFNKLEPAFQKHFKQFMKKI